VTTAVAPHPHPHRPTENPHAGQGPVVLDIGGEIGALVVLMPEALGGVEIEIHALAAGESAPRSHVAVVGRPVGERTVWSAVFPELVEGRYELYERPAGPIALTVDVRGGTVTEAAWPH
jgi:hypothetical protein